VYDDFSANALGDNTKVAVLTEPGLKSRDTAVNDTFLNSMASSSIDQTDVHEAFRSTSPLITKLLLVSKLVKLLASVLMVTTGATLSIISSLIYFSDMRVESYT